jgi:sugar phosphate permease
LSRLSGSNYRWYILALTMLTYAVVVGSERMALPVLFKEISVDLNLSLASIGTIWGMDPLAGIFTSLPGGLLVDRFGLKKTVTVIAILAGVFCALRGFSSSLLTFALLMFLFGVMATAAPSVAPKITAVWFRREQLGLTNALLNISWAFGSMFATLTSATLLSPALGGWRNVLFVLGAPAVLLGLLWMFTGREPRREELLHEQATQSPPLLQSLAHVLKMKEIWILGLICLTVWGANMGMMGYLPLYLRDIGWEPARADSVMTAFMASTTVGMVPMVLLSNRLKIYNGMFLFTIIILAGSLVLLPFVEDVWVWVVIVGSGLLRSAQPAVTNILILEMKGVGSAFGGTAVGLVGSIGMIGGTLAPRIGNGLSSYGPGAPFFFWAALSSLGIPLFIFLTRLWHRAETRGEALAMN